MMNFHRLAVLVGALGKRNCFLLFRFCLAKTFCFFATSTQQVEASLNLFTSRRCFVSKSLRHSLWSGLHSQRFFFFFLPFSNLFDACINRYKGKCMINLCNCVMVCYWCICGYDRISICAFMIPYKLWVKRSCPSWAIFNVHVHKWSLSVLALSWNERYINWNPKWCT